MLITKIMIKNIFGSLEKINQIRLGSKAYLSNNNVQ